MDYKKAYLILFNSITDSIRILENEFMTKETNIAVEKLKEAQQKTEELYIKNI